MVMRQALLRQGVVLVVAAAAAEVTEQCLERYAGRLDRTHPGSDCNFEFKLPLLGCV
jgi:hypothetical protein